MRRSQISRRRTLRRRHQRLETSDVIECLAHKWVPTVLLALREGPQRFFQLRQAAPGISPKALAETLRRLVGEGMVDHVVHSDVAGHVALGYALTPFGEETIELLGLVDSWVDRHYALIVEHRAAHGFDQET